MNIPYVKQHDQNGKVTNPILGSYLHTEENRQQRRSWKNQPPFHGNGKNHHLTHAHPYTYERVRQFETDEDGNKKVILHYLLKQR